MKKVINFFSIFLHSQERESYTMMKEKSLCEKCVLPSERSTACNQNNNNIRSFDSVAKTKEKKRTQRLLAEEEEEADFEDDNDDVYNDE